MTRKYLVHIWATLLCLTISNRVWSQHSDYEIFDLIKSMKYDEVLQSDIDSVYGPGKLIRSLTTLLNDAGQRDSLSMYLKLKTDSGSVFDQSMGYLIHGYAGTFYGRYSDRTLDKLTKALSLADSVDHLPLKKQVLLAMFDFYRKDLVQIDSGYIDWLNDYALLRSDAIDTAYYALNNFLFQSKSEGPVDDKFHRAAQGLDVAFGALGEDSELYPLYLFEKGIYFQIINEPEKASAYYERIIQTTPNLPKYRYVNFGAYLKLSQLLSYAGDLQGAMDMLKGTETYSDLAQPFTSKYYYYNYGAKYYENAGYYKESIYFFRKADTLRSRIDKVMNIHRRAEAEIAYNTLEKERLILKQERDLLLERERKNRNKNLAIALAFLFVLVSIISIAVHNNIRRKEQIALKEKDYQKQKVDNLIKQQELNSLNSMIEGQEKERKRIAEELHDRLGSTLSATKMHMDVLEEKVNSDSNVQTGRIKSLLDKAIEDTRQISHNLLSGVLDKFGLKAAMDDLRETINSVNDIDISIDYGHQELRLSKSEEVQMFRVVQELISNTLKHAHADKVSIKLEQREATLQLTFADDGIGFDTDVVSNGIGLKNIKSRLVKINANYTYQSDDNGTLVTINIPT